VHAGPGTEPLEWGVERVDAAVCPDLWVVESDPWVGGSHGPTEALNNLVKRIKRIGFGFRNFEYYRIRALLYAGRPNWRVRGSIVVR